MQDSHRIFPDLKKDKFATYYVAGNGLSAPPLELSTPVPELSAPPLDLSAPVPEISTLPNEILERIEQLNQREHDMLFEVCFTRVYFYN